MTTTEQYAYLAGYAYESLPVGVRKEGEEEKLTIGSRDYKIREHYSNDQTGYQGTIYQEIVTGEIIVAHRGTEPKDQNDLRADSQMATQRDNMQISDAIGLAERAIGFAERQHKANPDINPTITVTGHSLGGALAQVTAHRLGLHGETFNAYGAAALQGMPMNAGHGQVTNHVIATDMVSAAGPHFGDVKIYARLSDITALTVAGYGHNAVDKTEHLAVASLGTAHLMKYFTGEGSVLDNPEVSLKTAEMFHSIISEYRQDVYERRDIITNVLTEPPKVQSEPRYHGSYEFNEKGTEYKNYDVNPGMMGASPFIKQRQPDAPQQPKPEDTEVNSLAERKAADDYIYSQLTPQQQVHIDNTLSQYNTTFTKAYTLMTWDEARKNLSPNADEFYNRTLEQIKQDDFAVRESVKDPHDIRLQQAEQAKAAELAKEQQREANHNNYNDQPATQTNGYKSSPDKYTPPTNLKGSFKDVNPRLRSDASDYIPAAAAVAIAVTNSTDPKFQATYDKILTEIRDDPDVMSYLAKNGMDTPQGLSSIAAHAANQNYANGAHPILGVVMMDDGQLTVAYQNSGKIYSDDYTINMAQAIHIDPKISEHTATLALEQHQQDFAAYIAQYRTVSTSKMLH